MSKYSARYMGNQQFAGFAGLGALPASGLTLPLHLPAGVTPQSIAAAAAAVQDRVAQNIHIASPAVQGTLDPCTDGNGAAIPCDQLTDAQRPLCPTCGGGHSTGDASAAEAQCNCLLSAIPGLATDETNWNQGHTLCLQDPANFEAQIRAAGWTPNCGNVSAGAGGRHSNLSTGAKVGIGIGVAGVIGALALAFIR